MRKTSWIMVVVILLLAALTASCTTQSPTPTSQYPAVKGVHVVIYELST